MSGLVHTYPDIFDSGEFFSVLAFRSSVDCVFGFEKRRFSKTVARVEFLKTLA